MNYEAINRFPRRTFYAPFCLPVLEAEEEPQSTLYCESNKRRLSFVRPSDRQGERRERASERSNEPMMPVGREGKESAFFLAFDLPLLFHACKSFKASQRREAYVATEGERKRVPQGETDSGREGRRKKGKKEGRKEGPHSLLSVVVFPPDRRGYERTNERAR